MPSKRGWRISHYAKLASDKAAFVVRRDADRLSDFLFRGSPSTRDLFRRYWRAYGGWSALLDSFYCRAALLLTIIMAPLWWDYDWTSLVLSSIPSILGFSIAAYAAILAFSDRDFVDFIISPGVASGTQSGDGSGARPRDLETTAYMNLNATFLHFIIMQVNALITALFCNAVAKIQAKIVFVFASGISFCIYVYAILLAAAAGMAVFRIASIYQRHRRARLISRMQQNAQPLMPPDNDR